MIDHEGISLKLTSHLVEEFVIVDVLYQESRDLLPVTTNSAVYDAIANSICDEAYYNVMERLPETLTKLVKEITDRDPSILQRFTRELYDAWVLKGRPAVKGIHDLGDEYF